MGNNNKKQGEKWGQIMGEKMGDFLGGKNHINLF